MNTLKPILLLFTVISLCVPIYSQITIDGTITDSELNPIENALVQIINENDTTNVYSANTGELGYFSISGITDVKNGSINIPKNFIVLSNYPNPFNPSTMIYYELPKAENVEIIIYDILGREIRSLYNDFHKAGIYTIEWNGRNNWNSPVAAGIYLCRLKTQNQFKVNKMVLLDGGSTSTTVGNSQFKKNNLTSFSKADGLFNFSIKVSGSSILESEIKNLTCSGDTTFNILVPKILQTITIGPEGGELKSDGFSLKIPPKSFDAIYEVRVIDTPKNLIDESNTARIYGVEGLPLFFSKPISISIQPNNDLTEESYITVGYNYEIPFANESKIVSKFLNSYDSLGILKSELLPDSSLANSNLNKKSNYNQHKIYFSSETGYYSRMSVKNHFKIFTNYNDRWGIINELQNNLEEIFDDVRKVGFDTVNINWPVEVYIKKFDKYFDLSRNCIYYPTYGKKNMSLLIDLPAIVSEGKDFIREYAIGISRSYDDEFFLPNEFTGKVDPDRYWFHHALGSWFEEKREDPNSNEFFWPKDLNSDIDVYGDNRLAPFKGMRTGAGNNSRSALKHGGGMSTLIKYIDLNYGNAPIISIYELIRNQNLHPIEALKRILSNPEIWWNDYFEELIESRLYNFDRSMAFTYYEEGPKLNTVEDGYEFKERSDTLKTFKDISFTSLSAKSFHVGWNASNIDTNRILKVRLINNENPLLVYGGSSHEEYTLLGKGAYFSLRFSELLKLRIEEEPLDHIVIVVTNAENNPPYTNNTKISLEVKLEKKKIFSYKHCDIKIAVQSIVDTFIGGWSPAWYTDGSFTDNIYNGTINPDRQGGSNVHGTVRIKMDNDFKIVSLNVMAYHSDQYGSSQWGITAANIPILENDPYLLLYRIYGNSVCNYVTRIYAKYTYPDGNETEISKFKCEDESLLQVKFHNWD